MIKVGRIIPVVVVTLLLFWGTGNSKIYASMPQAGEYFTETSPSIGVSSSQSGIVQAAPDRKNNHPPTDIILSNSTIPENRPVNTVIGTFSTVDPDEGDSFIYTLEKTKWNPDNEYFNINGNELRTSVVLDYEAKSTYSIWVMSKDSGNLYHEKTFIITVNDVPEISPTDIKLSNNGTAEGQPVNTIVGVLTTTDQNEFDVFTYTLVEGEGSDDNGSFSIDNDNLRTRIIFDYEFKNSYSIRIRTTDLSKLYFEKEFIITVIDVPENLAPTGINLSQATIQENEAVNTVVGTLSTIDPNDDDNFIYRLVPGDGDADNSQFNINNNSLRSTSSFDYEIKSSYSIRIRTTDNGSLYFEKVFTITIIDIDESPPPSDGDGGGGGGVVIGGGGAIIGGGGGVVEPGATAISPYTNYQGLFVMDAEIGSDDESLILNIARGVLAKAKDNTALKSIKIVSIDDPPAPSGGYSLIGQAYEITPDGASFSPAITITIFYDPVTIPVDIDTDNLAILVLNPDTSVWESVASANNKTDSSVSADIEHFSTYALGGKAKPPETTPIVTTSPASFIITDLEITDLSGKVASSKEKTVVVTAEIMNAGGSSGECLVVLGINGAPEDSRKIWITANESAMVRFSCVRNEPGDYEVDVNGLKGSFTIQQVTPVTTIQPDELPSTSSDQRGPNWWIITGLILFGLSIVILSIIMAKKTSVQDK